MKIEGPATLLDSGRKISQLAQHAFCKLPQERFILLTHHTAFLFPHATRYNPKATLKILAPNACPCQRLLSFFHVGNPFKRLVFWLFSSPTSRPISCCHSSVCDLIVPLPRILITILPNDDRSRTIPAFSTSPAIERTPPKLNLSTPSHQPSYSYIEGY